ncbi:hypothetical protein BDU57DRAFT_517427 [Ampelomyces quisqualis]|uniref:RING-type domain-containing protein n=1 Tax=Ampelomyces quisqualis TaxID=50730 RepID=A0A6A5QSS2_AMPQU|nr:hypothetical protein BDU57DRAFT_517427 [Ampelomyces quisqualis]
MSDSNNNTPAGSLAATGAGAQRSESSAPRFNVHADPFTQPNRPQLNHTPYLSFFDPPMNPYLDLSSAPMGQHSQALSSNLQDGHYPRPPRHYYPYPGPYPYSPPQPPVPRRPVFSPNVPTEGGPNSAGFTGTGSMVPLPSEAMMRSVPGSFPSYPQGYDGSFAPANTMTPSIRQHYYAPLDMQPPVRYSGGHDFEASTRQSPDRPRQFHSAARRSSLQGARQTSSSNGSSRLQDHAERRTARIIHARGRVAGAGGSPPTSGRRAWEELHDFSVPAAFRTHRVFREHRMPLSRYPHHGDPNVATSRQIQELKDKLPRRLLGELPAETSSMCDICAKDYSCVHVKACEEEEVAIELACGHVFGEFCIFQWFDTCKTHKNKVTCPMCRTRLIEPLGHNTALLLSAMSSGDAAFQELLASELRGEYGQI